MPYKLIRREDKLAACVRAGFVTRGVEVGSRPSGSGDEPFSLETFHHWSLLLVY